MAQLLMFVLSGHVLIISMEHVQADSSKIRRKALATGSTMKGSILLGGLPQLVNHHISCHLNTQVVKNIIKINSFIVSKSVKPLLNPRQNDPEAKLEEVL